MHDEPRLRVISIGETMAMVTPQRAGPLETARDLHLDIAGAESNVASHVASFGYGAAWVGAVGDDALGRRVLRLLDDRGVSTEWVHLDPGAPTGVMFKNPGSGVLYYRRDSAASRMGRDTIRSVALRSVDVVHVSGITPALSQSCAAVIDEVVDQVDGSATQLSFDVNYRESLWPLSVAAPRLLAIAQRADLVFVGLDEAATLWGTTTPQEVRDLIDRPRRVVVKDGSVGATEFSADGAVFVASPKTEVVEEIGAGDAFAGAYIAACLSGHPARERLAAGHARAALVLQTTGDYHIDMPQTPLQPEFPDARSR